MTQARVSTFEVDELLVGLGVERVSEVVSDVPYVPVPLSHPSVVGLMNLRGRVLSVFDARVRLRVHPHRERAGVAVHVIVQRDGYAASLLVDRALDVVDLSTATPDELPGTIDPWLRSLTVGAYQADRRLLLLLDPDRLLDIGFNPGDES